MKPCKHCGGPIPCIECRKIQHRLQARAWALRNPEQRAISRKAYELRNPEKVKASKNAYIERNRKELNAAKRNPEANARKAELARIQYAKDPTPFLVRAKRRDERDAAVGGEFSQDDRADLFKKQCGICANPFCRADLSKTGFQSDHKVPVIQGGSHNPSNRQLLCPPCNRRKGTMTNEEWHKQQLEESA